MGSLFVAEITSPSCCIIDFSVVLNTAYGCGGEVHFKLLWQFILNKQRTRGDHPSPKQNLKIFKIVLNQNVCASNSPQNKLFVHRLHSSYQSRRGERRGEECLGTTFGLLIIC